MGGRGQTIAQAYDVHSNKQLRSFMNDYEEKYKKYLEKTVKEVGDKLDRVKNMSDEEFKAKYPNIPSKSQYRYLTLYAGDYSMTIADLYNHRTSIDKVVNMRSGNLEKKFISKVENTVGNIKTMNLKIGDDGTLNGTVTGTNGDMATVKSIGAGGYNIQTFHFRTLVHLYKKK